MVVVGRDFENHTEFHNEPAVVWLWWQDFTEDVSEVVQYDIQIFEAASRKSVHPRAPRGLVNNTFAMSLNLVERRAYFARVYAKNSVNLETYRDSEYFIVQTTAPILKDVYGECRSSIPIPGLHACIFFSFAIAFFLTSFLCVVQI